MLLTAIHAPAADAVCKHLCRATAVAARYLGLDCHLILRNSRALADADPGLTGNLLVERLAGAVIHQVILSIVKEL